MRTVFFILALIIAGHSLQAGIVKTFSDGYIVCVFDRPATMSNQGSKLIVFFQDPATLKWHRLPWKDFPSDPQWSRNLVENDFPTEELHNGGTLTIKKLVTICFENFKGGEIDVEFSVFPRRIKHLQRPPWKSLLG